MLSASFFFNKTCRSLSFLFLCLSSQVFASIFISSDAAADTVTGHITKIRFMQHGNAVLFQMDKPLSETPRCNKTGQFAIDLGKSGGNALLKALLVAKENGLMIAVTGLNTCVVHNRSEGVKYLDIL